jgi:hypothetical protein
MNPNQARVAFINLWVSTHPAREREECVHAAGRLLRLARSYVRAPEGPARGKAERRIMGLCDSFGVSVALDARGVEVRLGGQIAEVPD